MLSFADVSEIHDEIATCEDLGRMDRTGIFIVKMTQNFAIKNSMIPIQDMSKSA